MRLNHLDILEQCFREKFRGYNKEEVDAFMHLVADDFREMAEEIQKLKEELGEKDRLIETLKNSGAESPPPIDTEALKEKARQVILMARQQAQKHRQNAEGEMAALKNEIHKLTQEKSQLIQSIKDTVRDHLKK
ncbi:MAG: DivIVA domain-containing protein [Nitrospinaceae bacterium]|jgi:cell division initiation protein|nr:MAG: DivIVA domain-containing protein [Nitrospinaceae bacterium]